MIPKRIVRTVPETTTTEVETFWHDAEALHPDWDLRTYRDPLDPDDFPLTSPHWQRCAKPAQYAGLVRLEAIYQHGGIYIDSDLEPFRPFDPLLPLGCFATWEDAQTVPDFVFGAEAGHPAIGCLIDAALDCLEQGPWASGPGVFTRLLPGRSDVLLLPPGSFAPYHYSQRELRYENHRDAHPYAFGAHHWAGSWL